MRKTISSLSLAFSCAAITPAVAAEPPAETLWKTEYLDTVISLRPCPEKGICHSLYWLNPDDDKITGYFGDPEKKIPGRNGVLALCGFSPKTDFRQVAADRWEGQMEIRGLPATAGVVVTRLNENEMRVVTSIAIFSKTEKWVKVDPADARYPKCRLP
jgi:hypothetical protein